MTETENQRKVIFNLLQPEKDSRCFAYRDVPSESGNYSPPVCAETGLSEPKSMRRGCPIPQCTNNKCEFKGNDIPEEFAKNWLSIFQERNRSGRLGGCSTSFAAPRFLKGIIRS